jgi:CelD/BcsL family acetyltransferase involved in cellulose biosynthesis
MPSVCAESPVPCRAGPSRPRLTLHGRGDPGRAQVEAFIATVFAERFDAELRDFAPRLVALRDGDDIVAAAGYRGAADGPLFLEHYLDAPVEDRLSAGHGAAPPRRCIVEVGHLAAARAGEGRRLIRLLGPHLAAQGFQWVVSTTTEELRHLFLRLGVTPLALGRADPAALGAAAHRWGRYYEHRPVVLAGYLPQALRRLARASLDAVAP